MKILRQNYNLKEIFFFKNIIFKSLLNPKKIINFILVKLSLFLKLNKCLGLPIHALIEPIAICNYKCVKCERFSSFYKDDGFIFKNKSMPFCFFKKIIDEIGDTLLTLRLWHYGEPLLCGDIFKMIKYAKEKGIVVALSSNLSFLNERTAIKIIESGLDYLMISFDGASRYTYNLSHGNDYFNKVKNNIRILAQLKKRLNISFPFIELQFIIMRMNENEVDKIRFLANKLGVDKLVYQKIDVNNLDLNLKKNLIPKNQYFYLNYQKIKDINFCRIPWEETLIRYSGIVLPCALDISQKYKMGKLFNQHEYFSFKKIWNSNNYRNFRKQIISNINKINMCCVCAKKNNSNMEIKLKFKNS